jgi:hypothetical protein
MFRNGFFATAIAALVFAATAVAAAPGVTTTFHGTFAGPVDYVGCAAPSTVATGRWNVALHGHQDATIAINIFTNGKHHVAYGASAQQVTQAGEMFAFRTLTGAGWLTIRLVGAEMSYTITPYQFGDLVCGSVTYHGDLGR